MKRKKGKRAAVPTIEVGKAVRLIYLRTEDGVRYVDGLVVQSIEITQPIDGRPVFAVVGLVAGPNAPKPPATPKPKARP
jgi:hypothetical protein